MQHLLFKALFALLFFAPKAANAQGVTQLMGAHEYLEMKSGPEKIQKIRDLERRGWYHQDAYTDQRGNALESARVDLAPFVDDLGESVFLVTDVSPEFPGGPSTLNDYLQNLLGDLLARPSDEVQNTLFFKFSVLKDGKIDAIEPANPIPDWIPKSTSQRCLAAIRDMPAWSPGVFKENPVKVKVLMTFSLRK